MKKKLLCFGHVSMHISISIQSKEILQDTVEGKSRQTRSRKMWPDNIKDPISSIEFSMPGLPNIYVSLR